LEGES